MTGGGVLHCFGRGGGEVGRGGGWKNSLTLNPADLESGEVLPNDGVSCGKHYWYGVRIQEY